MIKNVLDFSDFVIILWVCSWLLVDVGMFDVFLCFCEIFFVIDNKVLLFSCVFLVVVFFFFGFVCSSR